MYSLIVVGVAFGLLPSALRPRHAKAQLMIRNTDRCELLVWTRAALDSPGLTDDDVVRLCSEAMEQSTLLVVAGDIDASSRLGALPDDVADALLRYRTAEPLSQTGLDELRTNLALSPDGFGGGEGFAQTRGQAATWAKNTEREPMPPRCVLLHSELASCLSARALGWRAVALPDASGFADGALDGFADAMIDDVNSLYISDLSSPGAYWVNAAFPRTFDETDGLFDEAVAAAPPPKKAAPVVVDDDDDDAAALAILRDLDSR